MSPQKVTPPSYVHSYQSQMMFEIPQVGQKWVITDTSGKETVYQIEQSFLSAPELRVDFHKAKQNENQFQWHDLFQSSNNE